MHLAATPQKQNKMQPWTVYGDDLSIYISSMDLSPPTAYLVSPPACLILSQRKHAQVWTPDFVPQTDLPSLIHLR